MSAGKMRRGHHRKRSSFVDETLPPPGPKTSWTSLSSAVVFLFLFISSWLALTGSAPSTWLGSWVYSHRDAAVLSEAGPALWPEGVNPPLASSDELEEASDVLHGVSDNASPDYHRYRWHADLKWDAATADGRLIVVGDIHGMIQPLKYASCSLEAALLSTSRDMLHALSYDNTTDTLILVGDLVAKAPSVDDSLAVVRLAREVGAQAVRGNHDDRVIEYRLWQEWNGAFLEADTAEWLDADSEPSDLRQKLPKGMKWHEQHFNIARRLPAADFKWLLHRPLSLHIRTLHTYIVHAGLIPARIPKSAKLVQEADEVDDLDSTSPSDFEPSDETKDRMTADDAVLLRRQNRSPSTILEMRGVTKDGTRPTSDGHKGTPWPIIWNQAMSECADPDSDCRALSVVYGHWASKSLQIDPYSIGLDSGCVYERSLSALVLKPDKPQTTYVYASALETRDAALSGREGVVYSLSCEEQ